VTDSLLCRVEESQNPSEYDRANLAMCFQLGFGVERNEEKSVGLMSCLDPNTVAITEANLEDFKKTYRYQYYNDSKFRTALKLGHLDSIDLAQIYASSANVEEVEDRCKRERSYVESVLGETHHIACTLASTLASLYYVRNKLESAASLQRFVLDTYHSKYGKASRHTQSAKLNLAATLREDCQYPQAEALYNEVFTLRSKELGTNHVDTLLVHSDLATMYLARGKWIEAEVSLREVVRQSVAVLGVHHPHSIFVRGNYASALQNNSKLSEAEKEQETVLGASMIIYGESNIDTFTSISNLMSIYNDGCFVHQKSGEHLTRTERATQTAEKLLGLNSTLTLKMLTCLAQAYIVRGAYQQANDILDKAINESEKNKGKTHPDTISMRGTVIHVLYEQDKLKEAESLSLLLLADMDEQENLDYPIVLRNLAAIYFGQMRYTEAVGVASKYYNMQLIRHSKKHPSTSAARDLLSKYQGAAAMETTAGCFE
jgi:tetratricopeptide (TPR) repeat protein